MARNMIRSGYPSNVFMLILIHGLFWISVISLISIDLTSSSDMVENYSWGQSFAWGNSKHPPLTGWLVGFWFRFLPMNHFFYYVFSYINVGTALWGIVCVARFFQREDKNPCTESIWWVLGLSVLSLAYGPLAATFNADNVQLAIWPWTTYFFLLSVTRKTTHLWLSSLLFALFSALCILAKYYSGILLICLFMVSLSNKHYRTWYRTPHPYFTLIMMLTLLSPHILWLYKMHFPTIQYMKEQSLRNSSLFHQLTFIIRGNLQQVLIWIVFAWFFIKYKPHKQFKLKTIISSESLRTLVLLTILPSIITTLLSMCIDTNTSTRWAKPIWYALPILMVIYLRPIINHETTKSFWHLLLKIWGCITLTSMSFLSYAVYHPYPRFSVGRKDFAFEIEKEFKKQMPNKALFKWVVGPMGEPSGLSFYLPSHPHALTSFPNEYPALTDPEINWQKENGVLFCKIRYLSWTNNKSHRFYREYQQCMNETEAWLTKNHRPIIKTKIMYKSADWRAKYVPKRFMTVYWYIA